MCETLVRLCPLMNTMFEVCVEIPQMQSHLLVACGVQILLGLVGLPGWMMKYVGPLAVGTAIISTAISLLKLITDG